QLHNIRMEQVTDDALWKTLVQLKGAGKVRYYGIALGPAIGWMYEGINAIREREITSIQHIYNMLEQHPGRAIHDAATEAAKDTMFLIRVPHSSGMLEGKYNAETVFPPGDHRAHRPRSWLLNGVKKIEQLRFLENADRTLGQAALQWLLADDRVASTLPNIYNEEQLIEFARAPETPPLTSDDMERIADLYVENFGIEEDPPKFKGTMELAETAAVDTCAGMEIFPKSPSEMVGGLRYFARMLDKIRLRARGELHSDYHANLGHRKAADGTMCNFLRIDYEQLRQRVMEGGTDEEILEWCYLNGRRLNEGDLFVWNNFSAKLGWNDFATPTLERRKKELGISDRTNIQTMGDLFDYEEGRMK